MTRMVNKRFTLKMIAGAAAASLLAPLSWAQTSATKFVSLVVPYPAGGTSDVIARALIGEMAKSLGQTVIVENQGGAGGTIAAQKVLNAPADGHAIFVGSPNELILAPMAIAASKFKSEDFQMIQKLGDFTLVVLAHKSIPASNVDELMAYAAQRAKEGNPLTYGSVGIGTIYHLLGEQISKLTGVPMTHVPYRGGSALMPDLAGGQIDLYFGSLGTNASGLISNGRLKVLGVISPERLDTYKSVPSVNESKSLKGFTYSLWQGLFVKKGTPEPVIQVLHKAATSALNDPAVARTAMGGAQMVLAKPQTLAQAEQAYADSIERYRAIAKSIGLKPE
ncbi:MAG: tripartite tricarboxylate transporter substrate binding protein [Proteobacteria bacterium]|nr:tripartite tricarboxylate transporter substrate binding protein [Pseudomonadota bacterium]